MENANVGRDGIVMGNISVMNGSDLMAIGSNFRVTGRKTCEHTEVNATV